MQDWYSEASLCKTDSTCYDPGNIGRVSHKAFLGAPRIKYLYSYSTIYFGPKIQMTPGDTQSGRSISPSPFPHQAKYCNFISILGDFLLLCDYVGGRSHFLFVYLRIEPSHLFLSEHLRNVSPGFTRTIPKLLQVLPACQCPAIDDVHCTSNKSQTLYLW